MVAKRKFDSHGTVNQKSIKTRKSFAFVAIEIAPEVMLPLEVPSFYIPV